MTRSSAALRKAQHNLFAPGPAAALAPQAEPSRRHAPFVHPCQAPGCSEWGERGFAGGRFYCFAHRALGDGQGHPASIIGAAVDALADATALAAGGA